MAEALKARCVLADVRWRWTLKVLQVAAWVERNLCADPTLLNPCIFLSHRRVEKPPVGRSKIRPVCDRGVKLVLPSFTRETDGTVTDGAFPEAGLIFDSNGARYGTMSTGGSAKNVTSPRFSAAFCLFRCDIPEGGMKPLTIVVSFDVGEQVTEHGCRGSPRQK